MKFDPQCKRCPRLSEYLQDIKLQYPDYHCAPVPAVGDSSSALLIMGLAPGLHGANATGIPFTGDASGELLFQTLFRTGFAEQTTFVRDDVSGGLKRCRISNAVKCLPPQNKPTPAEFTECNDFLKFELEALPTDSVVVALGKLAHDALLRAKGLTLSHYPFGHLNEYKLSHNCILIDSYHCSRYNTQTKRLTPEMFEKVFMRVNDLIDKPQKENT